MPLMLVLFPNCMESFENDLSRINFAEGAEKFRLIFAKSSAAAVYIVDCHS